jgi:hypothetical protein
MEINKDQNSSMHLIISLNERIRGKTKEDRVDMRS